MKKVSILFFLSFAPVKIALWAQPVPAEVENIPYLMTIGPGAEKSWGDDDFSQTFSFLVPESYKKPIYTRVFDPDTGGAIDELNGNFDAQMLYSVYGDRGAYSDPDARETDPVGNYKSGTLLASRKFGVDPKCDNKWFTFGPFLPTVGEYIKVFGSCYIFKAICDGVSGDDGNILRFYMSASPTENKPIERAHAFACEYSFRVWNYPNEVSHIYPYIDDRAISVRLSNFDWDNDSVIREVSIARPERVFPVSKQDEWKTAEFTIKPEERISSLDFQFIQQKSQPVKNDNVVINVRNQYGELLRFYTVPIGGVPKFKYTIKGIPRE